MLFDLLVNTPEWQSCWLDVFSDHGTPVGWRFESGYGSHTFDWVHKEEEFVFIQYHFKVKHGQKQFTEEEAIRISGKDSNYSKRDLWDAFENVVERRSPSYEAGQG